MSSQFMSAVLWLNAVIGLLVSFTDVSWLGAAVGGGSGSHLTEYI